jgi:hypothetical protein
MSSIIICGLFGIGNRVIARTSSKLVRKQDDVLLAGAGIGKLEGPAHGRRLCLLEALPRRRFIVTSTEGGARLE